jgi:adenosylhomocysteine nucleosidase
MSSASRPEPLAEAQIAPCHVGLVFAMDLEAGAFEDRLSGLIAIRGSKFTAKQGGLKGRGIVSVHSGVGRENAAAAAAALIAGHHPTWVISAGLAGGLQSNVNRGEIVMPSAIVAEDGRRLAIDLRMSAGDQPSGLHVGPLLTMDRVAFKAEQKRQLGKQHGALAVDMETLGVAEVCQHEKQRFLAVRIISDGVDDELPPDVERLVRKKTWVRRIGAAAGTIVRRPSTVKDLWRFRETAITCSRKLAKFLEGVIEQLD